MKEFSQHIENQKKLKRGSGDQWKGSERVGNKERHVRVVSKTYDAICNEMNKNM